MCFPHALQCAVTTGDSQPPVKAHSSQCKSLTVSSRLILKEWYFCCFWRLLVPKPISLHAGNNKTNVPGKQIHQDCKHGRSDNCTGFKQRRAVGHCGCRGGTGSANVGCHLLLAASIELSTSSPCSVPTCTCFISASVHCTPQPF